MKAKRLARILRAREASENAAKAKEAAATAAANKAGQHLDNLEESQRAVAKGRSATSAAEMALNNDLLESSAKAVSAAASARRSAANDALAATEVRQEHTRQRKQLEKAHERIARAEKEHQAAKRIKELQDIAITKASTEDNK